jgi:hypothetical protein
VRSLLLTILLVMAALPAHAVERWQTLPLPQVSPAAERSGQLSGNGISIYDAIYGHGSPVILLHGGLGVSEAWGIRYRRWSGIIRSSLWIAAGTAGPRGTRGPLA